MKLSLITLLFSVLSVVSCTGQSDQRTSFVAGEFTQKLAATPNALLLDVRTPAEFSGRHLKNAVNMNWNDPAFKNKVATLDKSAPVFVYCLSGVRSAEAATYLREKGFKEVYELEGGTVKGMNELQNSWVTASGTGMTTDQYKARIDSDKIVLVDFYADWCAPCKQMEPYISRISKEMSNVEVIRIDADQNPDLCAALGVDALPAIKIYKDQKLSWDHNGFVSEQDLLEKLK